MQISDQRQALLSQLEKEGLGLSRLLISLATGTVVLSITFLQILFEKPLNDASLLISAWVALVLSIVLGLIDRIVYIHGLSEHPLLVITENNAEEAYQQKQWLRLANASEKLSWGQVITFGSGIIFFLIFAISSI